MYIKIYFGEKPLFLCDSIDNDIQPFVHHDDAVFIDELSSHTIKTMIHEMQQPMVHAGVFYDSNFEKLKKEFTKKFTVVQAAGGLVLNEKKEILMIFRRGKWDLPKGKLDDGEKLKDCAIREVEEETGLTKVKLKSLITITYHTYHEGTKFILKETHWFGMTVSGKQNPVPQTAEDISEIKWVNQNQSKDFLKKNFPLLSDIFIEAQKQKLLTF